VVTSWAERRPACPAPVDPRDSPRALEILDVARRSSRGHAVLDVTETGRLG